jgi:PAS domain S-box-containing protein
MIKGRQAGQAGKKKSSLKNSSLKLKSLRTSERKQMEEALQESRDQLAFRNRISNVFLTKRDDEIYSEVLSVVLDVLKSKYGYFGYINEDSDLVCPSMTRDIGDECKVPEKDIVFPKSHWAGIWGRSLIEKKSISKNKSLNLPEGHVPLKNALTVPIIHLGEIIGQFAVGNKSTDYNKKDRQWLESIAEYVSPILHERIFKLSQEDKRKKAEEALRKSQNELRLMYNAITDFMTVISRDFRILSANRVVENLYGQDLCGKVCYEVYQARNETCPDCPTKKAIETKKPAFSFQPSTEVSPPVEIYAFPIFDEEGEVIAVVEHGKDITERMKAEEILKESERHFRETLENANMIAVHLDNNGNILFANKYLLNLSGWGIDEISGKNWMDIFTPEEIRDEIKELHNKIVSTGQMVEKYENEIITKDGERRLISWTNSHSFDSDGNIIGSTSLGEDITERKKAENVMKESEERFRRMAEDSPIAIVVINKNGNIEYINKKHIEIMGYTHEDIPTLEHWWSLAYSDEENRKEIVNNWNNIVNEVSVRRHTIIIPERKVTCKDGSVKDVELKITPANGKLLVVFDDITERKRIEEELLKAEKLESIGILAGGIAHDFNNVLQSIFLNVSTAKLFSEKGSKANKILKETEKNLDKAKYLTQQLLTFSKGGVPVKKTLSLSPLVQNSVRFSLSGSNVKSEISIAEDLWPVEADEGQINQVIQNIVINADHAMPEGGNIKVSAENRTINARSGIPLNEGKYVVINIEDTGIGISEEYLSKVFDPYFTTKQKGSGIGLATSYSIIKKHEGLIKVYSKIGTGTTFSIYLPASVREVPAEREEDEGIIFGRGRILVMDDEQDVLKSVEIFMKSSGYEIEIAEDGNQAIEIYKHAKETGRDFDAVILDLTIPGGMGGKETIKKLLEIDPKVKAIVSSGYADDQIMAEYRDYGFMATLSKPYNDKELSKTLHEVITTETGK